MGYRKGRQGHRTMGTEGGDGGRVKLGPKVRPGAPRRDSGPGWAMRAGAERLAGAGPRRERRGWDLLWPRICPPPAITGPRASLLPQRLPL